MIRAQNSYYLPPDGTHLITTLLNRIGSTHCFAIPLPQRLPWLSYEGRNLRGPIHSRDISKLAFFDHPLIQKILQN